MIINGKALLDAAPIKHMFTKKFTENGISFGLTEAGYDIRLKQGITLSPDRPFALVSAMEEFQMPGCLIGVVHDKSTHARRGIAVQNTVIEPGWRGFLTLELTYHGRDNVTLPAGIGIAQVIFHELAEPAHYSGKYQDQADEPVEAKYE